MMLSVEGGQGHLHLICLDRFAIYLRLVGRLTDNTDPVVGAAAPAPIGRLCAGLPEGRECHAERESEQIGWPCLSGDARGGVVGWVHARPNRA